MPPVLSSPLASLELGVDDFAQHFENHVLLLSSHCYCWEEVIWLFEDGYFASNVIPTPFTLDQTPSHQDESPCG